MKKLELKKQVIATLNKNNMSVILGGETVVHPITYANCETRVNNTCQTEPCIYSIDESRCKCVSWETGCEISTECDLTMICLTEGGGIKVQ